MSRHKKIVPPIMVNTGVTTADSEIIATTPDTYKQLVEKEYAPEQKELPKMRTFYGVGTRIPKINGKNIKIAFSSNFSNTYSTSDESVIAWLIEKGFKEAV